MEKMLLDMKNYILDLQAKKDYKTLNKINNIKIDVYIDIKGN